jgi:hypothetical protein
MAIEHMQTLNDDLLIQYLHLVWIFELSLALTLMKISLDGQMENCSISEEKIALVHH